MALPGSPVPRDLLPPLLACLPTAFVSPRPPPALLPLLSPILRQRVQYSAASAGADGWLSLLSWDPHRAAKLAEKVEVLQLEPHPVSGELELGDVHGPQYRRLDEETLQARFELEQFDLLPVFVWCESDTQGGTAGWKLAELRALEDAEDGTRWHASVAEANEDAAVGHTPAHATNGPLNAQRQAASGSHNDNDNDDDDDDYWASYDRTPGRTPGIPSPAPPSNPSHSTRPSAQDNDDDYYSRYASVQPAMDAHDPDEAPPTATPQAAPYPSPPIQRSLYPADPLPQSKPPSHQQRLPLQNPRPLSPASSTSNSSRSVEKLERGAVDMTRAEAGVTTFIGAEIRNLFRLARSVGLDRAQFEEAVKREMEVVGMLED